MLTQPQTGQLWDEPKPTALLVLADGTVLEGFGFGATGHAVGEVCFNTAMTGYEEILTDPSYAGQIITFTFPHIGNVGTNEEDIETVNLAATPGARGVILHSAITDPSNYRATRNLDSWLKSRGVIGLAGIDTRALTAFIRNNGMPQRRDRARAVRPLRSRSCSSARRGNGRASSAWTSCPWSRPASALPGKRRRGSGAKAMAKCATRSSTSLRLTTASSATSCASSPATAARSRWCRRKPRPPTFCALKPDGIFLSNGPGDPAATGEYAVPVIRALIEQKPVFGICLGHQMLGLAVGAKTIKMHQGHHGANHPVKDIETGKVEITSMNHGFAVDRATLPPDVVETHVSLFDGSNCGLKLKDKPVFSVQYHPEASPGPRDSHGLFKQFVAQMRAAKRT